jgi:hypothetical protein
MTPAPSLLHVRWIAADAGPVRLMVAAALGADVPAGVPVDIPGLRLEIPAGVTGIASGSVDRLDVAAVDSSRGRSASLGAPAIAGARLLALGWATVDHDRAAEMAPGTRWKVVPRDAPLGARGLLGDAAEIGAAAGAPRAAAAVLLLEPDTEGRVAASLARQGEGPAVLYVGLPVRAVTGARARLARLGIRVASGPGPFGSEAAIMGAPASGPTLVLVDLPGARRARRDARRRRGTIKL